MAKLTEAQQEAKYDAERSGGAWKQVIDILLDDQDDGTEEIELAREVDRVLANATADDDDLTIPPELAGDGQAILGHVYDDVMIVIDKRDGGMVIARKDEIGGRLLERDEVIALRQFIDTPAVRHVIMYHWSQHMRTTGSPELISLLDWAEKHFAAEEAAERAK